MARTQAKRVGSGAVLLGALVGLALGQAFEYKENIDPITDVDRSLVTVYSDNFSTSPGGALGYGALTIRCDGSGGFEYYFRFAGSVARQGRLALPGFHLDVIYRFDTDPPVYADWSINASIDGAIGRLPQGPGFVQRLGTSDRFVLRFEGRAGEETLVFTTTGIARHLERLSCLER